LDLSRLDLSGINFSEAIIHGVNLEEANIENSIWHKDDVRKRLLQFTRTKFFHIIIEDSNGKKRVSRSEFFDGEW